ncbi:MAG: chorismate synthase [Clostridia bacterium]|nr:chorismate synthase [Clostridia bacterium]
MASTIGENIKITIFGQSHSPAIGVTIDGFPCGFEIDKENLAEFMARRAPGNDKFSTQRKEADKVEFLSGLTDCKTNGAPITAVIYNKDQRSKDYSELFEHPRPGHADYTARMKYGDSHDIAGGGHFSGRLTAPLCIAGGICLQWLEKKGITIGAHISSVHGIEDKKIDAVNVKSNELNAIKQKDFPCIDDEAAEKMKAEINAARMDCDSVGGTVECAAVGLPVGIGEPIFGGLESKLSQVIFGIPAVKGIEFGLGFESANLFGSENNDEFYIDENGEIKTRTNNCGGILGGISNAMPLVFKAAFKPTPSIAKTQNTVSIDKNENYQLNIVGRHDPCIVKRAVPVVEAAAAFAIADLMISRMKDNK